MFDITGTTILGSGAFGHVVKGTYRGTQVAIKMLKNNPNRNVEYLRSLLGELKVMSYLGSHPNLVGLIGAITSNIKGGEVYLIFEYCSKGNAHKFVRDHRETFVNMIASQLPSHARGTLKPSRYTFNFAQLLPLLQCRSTTGRVQLVSLISLDERFTSKSIKVGKNQ